MDSMRNMSTSLPQASSRRRGEQPTDLLSDFKAAALSVTNLYKTAATAQTRATATGYQNALDDLLQFLDKENLGLMDGEGWRVRQWATERLDGEASIPQAFTIRAGSASTDDEEESSASKEEEKDGERSCSPEVGRRLQRTVAASSDIADEDANALPISQAQQSRSSTLPQDRSLNLQPSVPQSSFNFRSTTAFPSRSDKEATPAMEVDALPSPMRAMETSDIPTPIEPVRILPRAVRNKTHTGHNRRNEKSSTGFTLNLSSSAGGKRKIPYPDFFDISGMSDGGNDRTGKRGRHA